MGKLHVCDDCGKLRDFDFVHYCPGNDSERIDALETLVVTLEARLGVLERILGASQADTVPPPPSTE